MKKVTIEKIFSVIDNDGKIKHYRGKSGFVIKNVSFSEVLLQLEDGEKIVVPKAALK